MKDMEKLQVSEWIQEIAGDVTWKKEALHEALDKGYEIRLVKNDRPIILSDGEVAFADNGVIGIVSNMQVVLKADKKD